MSAGDARKHFTPTEVAEALRCSLNGDGSDLSVPDGTVALAPCEYMPPGFSPTRPGGFQAAWETGGSTIAATIARPTRKLVIHTFGTRVWGHPAKYRHDDRPRHSCRHSVVQFLDRSHPLVGSPGRSARRLVGEGNGSPSRQPGRMRLPRSAAPPAGRAWPSPFSAPSGTRPERWMAAPHLCRR